MSRGGIGRCLRPAALLLAAALPACGEVARGPGVAVRDSAGIQVVENSPETLASAATWSLAPEPSLHIYSRDGEGMILFQIADVAALDGGRVAVANGGSDEVLIFSPRGDLLRRIGGAGAGPGQFASVSALVPLPGDSLAVLDGERQRLSVFGPDGAHAREIPLPAPPQAGGAITALPLEGGEVVVFGLGGFPAEPSVARTPAESFRISAAGEVLARYGPFPGAELFRDSRGAGLVLFGAATAAATAGDRLVVGLAERPELLYYARDGSLERIVRWPDHERVVTDARLDAFLDAGMSELPEVQRPAVRAFLEQAPRAPLLPPYENLISSDEGDLWVGEYVGPEQALRDFRMPERRWLVFDRLGALRAVVRTPQGFRPYRAHQGQVLGVYKDELGLEFVRAYAIQLPPSA